jgi:Cu(I)/Ag(I) efflux system periplasmic protein CusF
MRLFFSGSLLILLAACADQGATAAAPSPGSALLAVDLGGSSRISRIAGRPGEGEGYDVAQAVAPAPVPARSENDHSQMDHSQMDHSQMGHGTPSGPAPQLAQAAQVQGSGTINSVDAANHKIGLSHNPIPAIGWPAMTMEFAVAPSVDLKSVKPGTRVDFAMQRGGDGMYVIQSVKPAGGQ